jgi:hypothetical protein
MNTKRSYLVLILTILVAISVTNLWARSSDVQATEQGLRSGGILNAAARPSQPQSRKLEGSWAVTVTPVPAPGGGPLPDRFIYLTFTSGGALIGSDRGLPFASPQHGVWEHLGNHEFIYITVQDLFDAAGNFQGTLKVKSKITMTGPDEFVAVSNPQIRNAAGNLILDACSTSRAQRIKTESLLERCQSITPPQ